MNERDLINACIKNNRSSQRLFFERYAGKLLLVSRLYARNEAEAEDFVQETFIRAFKHLDSFQFKSSVETWLKRILINLALKHIKRKSFQLESIGVEQYPEQTDSENIISELSFNEILDHIEKLPYGYRIVFSLNVLDGYSHKEIAEMLDIQESTSRSQLLKARRFLQISILKAQKIHLHE